MELINIEIQDDKQARIIVGREIAEKINIALKKDSNIRFGFKVAEVAIEISEELDSQQIRISKRIIDKLNMPLTCSYNLAVKNNEIVIGPFIGIYLGKNETEMLKKIRIINNYLKSYKEINGAVFSFSLDCINKESLTIRGLLYNPELDIWEEAIMPYPSSIFVKATLNKEWREYFSVFYGDKIFNHKPINKWEMYERLAQFPQSNNVLPPTKLYVNKEDIVDFLEICPDIYVKPISGLKGLGIYNIVKDENDIIVKTRNESANLEWRYDDLESFYNFLSENIIPKKFIMQKTLDIQFGKKMIDFRIGLDKDQSGSWRNEMFVARISGDDNIVSNRASGGQAGVPNELFKELFNMTEEEAELFCEKIISHAYEIVGNLEQTGFQYGKLVLDMSVDRNQNIWLIEINNKNPGNDLLLDLKEYKKYYQIRSINMLYAKKLAGFDERHNETVYKFNELQSKRKVLKKRYKIFMSGTVQNVDFEEFVLKAAEEFNLPGAFTYMDDEKMIMIEVRGIYTNVSAFLDKIKGGTGTVIIRSVSVQKSTSSKSLNTFSIKEGIETIYTDTISSTASISSDLDFSKLSKELKELKEENKAIKKRHDNLLNSKAWRFTAPIRKLIGAVKTK